MIEQRPDLRTYSKPVLSIARWRRDRVEPPLTVGGYVNTPDGWGQVENITSHDTVIVSLFRLRPDPGRQSFPEYEAMQRFEALREKKIAEGCAVKW